CTTRHRFELIDLTPQVEELVTRAGIREGMALLQSLHSTAALFVNEWQEALLEDFRALLEQAVRADAPWRHNDPAIPTVIAAMPRPTFGRFY
ncbi:MAG TPA: YjbQ family protein, partial [Bryobacteraceae bacterium]|nr:YjbQ family protein [Bryobacteraceae bacterium]